MPIPTELSQIATTAEKLQNAYKDYIARSVLGPSGRAGQGGRGFDQAVRGHGQPVVTDRKQRESSFATYSITDTLAGTGLADNLAGDGQFFAIFDEAITASCRGSPAALPLQDLRVGIRQEEPGDRHA